ncbi:MAG: hypothetical protein ACM65K_11025 [Microcoleus sp.]
MLSESTIYILGFFKLYVKSDILSESAIDIRDRTSSTILQYSSVVMIFCSVKVKCDRYNTELRAIALLTS